MARAAGWRSEGRTDLVGVRGILVLAGFVAALAVAFLAAWPRLVETPAVQEELVRQLRAAGGADLSIDGATRLELLPRPRVTIANAVIGDRAQGAAGARLVADRIDIQLAALALLRGRVEPVAVDLVRPRLELAPPGAGSVRGLIAALGDGSLGSVSRIEVSDGMVAIADRPDASLRPLADVVDGLAVREAGNRFRLEGSAIVGGEPVRFGLSGEQPADAGALPVSIKLESGPGDRPFLMEFTGLVKPGPAATGRVRLSSEQGLPPAWLAGSFGLRGTLDARLEADPQRVELTELALTLPDGDLRGSAAFDLARGGAFAVALTSAGLEVKPELIDAVSRLLDLLRHRQGHSGGRVELQFASLTWRGEALRRLSVEAELSPAGEVELRRLDAVLPGQAVLGWSGSATADAGTVAGEVTLQAAELRPLLSWLGVADADLPPGGLTTLDLAAEAVLGSDRVELRRLRARLDASVAAGSVVYALTPRPRLDLALSVDRINTALYTAPPAGWADWRRRLIAVDGRLDLEVASLTRDLLRAGEVRVQATLDAGQFSLARLHVGNLAEAALELSGAMDLPSGAWDVAGTLAAAKPKPLLRLFGLPAPLDIDQLAPLRLEGEARHEAGRTSLDLKLQARDAQARLVVQSTDPFTAGPLGLTVTAEAEEAGAVLQALGWPAPAERPVFGPIATTVRVKRGEGPLAVTAQASVGDSRIAAELNLEPSAAPPLLKGTIRSPLMETELLAALYQTLALPLDVPPGNPLLWPGAWPRSPLAWDWLYRLRVDLAVAIDQLRHGGAALGSAAARTVLQDGQLDLDGLSIPAAGGRLAGDISLAGSGTQGVFSSDLRLTEARVQDLAARMAPGSTVQGVIDLSVAASGKGRSIAEIVGSLTGSGVLALRDLGLSGVALGAQAPGRESTARLDAAALDGPFVLSDGILSSQPPGLVLRHPAGEATLDLRVDLLAWILEAKLSAGPVTRRYLGPPGRVGAVADP